MKVVVIVPTYDEAANIERLVVALDEVFAGLPSHEMHLLVHGALHAQGWDHERVREARAMQSRESAILGALGFADPYAPG